MKKESRKYTMSPAARKQRRAASAKAVAKRPPREKWVSSGITLKNKVRAVEQYGSVNAALSELFRRDDLKAALNAKREPINGGRKLPVKEVRHG